MRRLARLRAHRRALRGVSRQVVRIISVAQCAENLARAVREELFRECRLPGRRNLRPAQIAAFSLTWISWGSNELEGRVGCGVGLRRLATKRHEKAQKENSRDPTGRRPRSSARNFAPGERCERATVVRAGQLSSFPRQAGIQTAAVPRFPPARE